MAGAFVRFPKHYQAHRGESQKERKRFRKKAPTVMGVCQRVAGATEVAPETEVGATEVTNNDSTWI